jgi:NTP pyrophosphatase (non-canonical NTP hydrolase)
MNEASSEIRTVREYADEARKTDRFEGIPPAEHYEKLSFGFFGEVGGLLAALKKLQRDEVEVTAKQAASEELGDALWYLANASRVCGVDPMSLGSSAYDILRKRFAEVSVNQASETTLLELDSLCGLHHRRLEQSREALLREAAAISGRLTARSFEELSALELQARGEVFGEVLAQLAILSASFSLTLARVASANLAKAFDRWPDSEKGAEYVLPKPGGESFEQFPPVMKVTFIERKVGSRRVVVQQMHGLNIGDPLTDNSHRPDGYRYHDVFHLAYAVHLGWSPVIRALLKLKRKSDGRLDENEDGARAVIIEEGIATWIFNNAGAHQMYAKTSLGRLDYALLRQVRSMTQGFEVKQAPLWQWERAILEGFQVFRQLLANKCGTVVANLGTHELTYEPPTPETAPA